MPAANKPPTVAKIALSVRIFEAVLVQHRSVADLQFAVDTVIALATYMRDNLEETAVKTKQLANELTNGKHDLIASNDRLEEYVNYLALRVKRKRAAEKVTFEQASVPRMARFVKKTPSKLTRFRKANLLGKKEERWKLPVGGAGDVVPDATEIGSG